MATPKDWHILWMVSTSKLRQIHNQRNYGQKRRFPSSLEIQVHIGNPTIIYIKFKLMQPRSNPESQIN